jgi:hypothetical protein
VPSYVALAAHIDRGRDDLEAIDWLSFHDK